MLAGALLLANHASSGNVSSAQSRAELIGALLVCACFYAPELGRRIQEATTGSSSSSKKNWWICSVGPRSFSGRVIQGDEEHELRLGEFAALTNTNAKASRSSKTQTKGS